MSMSRVDHDSPWKEILHQYFQEAITLFFPEVAQVIDWQRNPEFLDKEFQQIAPDAELGKRYADQLVKVWRTGGEELWLLIHLEVQAQPEANFEERMFIYCLRIFDRFQRLASSLAILCDRSPTWRPHRYELSAPDTRLSFEFGTVKLLDYQERWATLEASRNPFATVVMAHLKAQATRKNATTRKAWKLQLIRRLYDQGYPRREVVNLFKFIDWVMKLPVDLDQAFWTELRTYEEEQRMPYITSVERIGFERGIQEGRQEEGRSLVLKLLTRRVGEIPESLKSPITQLSVDQLEALGEALLDFRELADLEAWFQTHGQ
ncbi:MAG: DUF4351 domain-containing protein [Leptolyngbyaceae bacterium]|nr:DUF4351 domain-containing protein [Leptolyngbyaceae bacterium]